MAKAASEKTTKRTTLTKAVTRKPAAKSADKGMNRIKVRMYCQGLGDCFLLTIPGKGGKNYYVLIDCGVVFGTPDASTKMTAIVSDAIRTTNGKIDLLVVTLEHWDHVSGWVQTRDMWNDKDGKDPKKLKVD